MISLLAIPEGRARLKVLPDYEIQFDQEPYLVLVFGTLLNTAANRFRHPNLLGKCYAVHHVRHYHPNGSKSWSNHCGANLYLAVRKANVKVVPEHGFSYPKVVIAGKTLTFNVSGGGGATWVDWVSTRVATSIDHLVATLKAIADAALSVDEARAASIRLNLAPPAGADRTLLEQALARPAVRQALQPGQKLQLAAGCSYCGETQLAVLTLPAARYVKGRLVNLNAEPKAYLCTPDPRSDRVKVKFSQVDWAATCRLNGLDPASADDAFNRLPLAPGEQPPAQPDGYSFGDLITEICSTPETA